MSDSQKLFTLYRDGQTWSAWSEGHFDLNDQETIKTIEYSAYDQLMQQAEKMREALGLTKANIGFGGPANAIAAIDRINKALEQFDEFMKDKK